MIGPDLQAESLVALIKSTFYSTLTNKEPQLTQYFFFTSSLFIDSMKKYVYWQYEKAVFLFPSYLLLYRYPSLNRKVLDQRAEFKLVIKYTAFLEYYTKNASDKPVL